MKKAWMFKTRGEQWTRENLLTDMGVRVRVKLSIYVCCKQSASIWIDLNVILCLLAQSNSPRLALLQFWSITIEFFDSTSEFATNFAPLTNLPSCPDPLEAFSLLLFTYFWLNEFSVELSSLIVTSEICLLSSFLLGIHPSASLIIEEKFTEGGNKLHFLLLVQDCGYVIIVFFL